MYDDLISMSMWHAAEAGRCRQASKSGLSRVTAESLETEAKRHERWANRLHNLASLCVRPATLNDALSQVDTALAEARALAGTVPAGAAQIRAFLEAELRA